MSLGAAKGEGERERSDVAGPRLRERWKGENSLCRVAWRNSRRTAFVGIWIDCLSYQCSVESISSSPCVYTERRNAVISIFPVSPVVDRGTLPSHAAAHYNRVNELTLIIMLIHSRKSGRTTTYVWLCISPLMVLQCLEFSRKIWKNNFFLFFQKSRRVLAILQCPVGVW